MSPDFWGFTGGMLHQQNPEACAVAKRPARHSSFWKAGWQATTPPLSQVATVGDRLARARWDLLSLLPAGPAGHLNLLRPGALCQQCTAGGSQRWPPHAAPKHELSDDASTAHLCWHHRCPAAQHEGSDTPSRPSPCSRHPWGCWLLKELDSGPGTREPGSHAHEEVSAQARQTPVPSSL